METRQLGGSAWIYYIFAVCQWLPTNHRIHYGDKSGYDREKCKLCLMNAVDDTNHIYICPALSKEQLELYNTLENKLRQWQVAYAYKTIESLEEKTCKIWFRKARSTFPLSNGSHMSISSERLKGMIKNFWHANQHRNLSSTGCISNIQNVLERSCRSCPVARVCNLQCNIKLPNDLLSLLILRLQLHLEGTTNALHRSTLFTEWCSTEASDRLFGAHGSILEQDLAGHNSFVFLHNSGNPRLRDQLHGLIQQWTLSKKPTRVVMIAPSKDVEPWLRPAAADF